MGAEAWSLMYPSVPAVLKEVQNKGFDIVIFTNESNIGRFTKARKKAIDSKVGRLSAFSKLVGVPVQSFIACGRNGSGDLFRKPETGFWHLMAKQRCDRQIDLARSFFVGDAAGRDNDHSDSDKEFAQSLGLPFFVPEEAFVEASEAWRSMLDSS